jgi:hypothetical protein
MTLDRMLALRTIACGLLVLDARCVVAGVALLFRAWQVQP